MELTEGGREALERYLAQVEQSLRGRPEIEARDVVAGLREHVETEVALIGGGVATAEEIAEVLERLGAPEALAHDGAVGHPAGSPRRWPPCPFSVRSRWGWSCCSYRVRCFRSDGS